MLLGIAGKKRVGKDTAASFLVNDLEYKRVAFADKLKDAANAIFCFEDLREEVKEKTVQCRVYDSKLFYALKKLGFEDIDKTIPAMLLIYEIYAEWIDFLTDTGFVARISPRVAYQLLGTEFGRAYDENFWVNKVDITNPNPNTVITDVRFDNEAKFIKENNGFIIKIENPKVEETSTSTHASERGVSDEYIDAVIINDGSIQKLEELIKEVVEALKCK